MTLDQKALEAAVSAYEASRINPGNGEFRIYSHLRAGITAYLDALASRSSAIVEEPMAECRLVPVEPTEAMLEAYQGALRRYIEALPPEAKTKGSFGGYWVPAKHKARVRWAAMLAASPSLNAALTVEPEAPDNAFAEYEGVPAKELAETVARYGKALKEISSPTQTEGLLWWQIKAREALAGVEPEAGEVTVKPLVWNGLAASTPFGDYEIARYGKYWAVYLYRDLVAEPQTEDAARAAAQADYTARIRSALAP